MVPALFKSGHNSRVGNIRKFYSKPLKLAMKGPKCIFFSTKYRDFGNFLDYGYNSGAGTIATYTFLGAGTI